MTRDNDRTNPQLVSLSTFCLGFCGRNTMDDTGSWTVIDDGCGYTLVWCSSCWRKRESDQQERDAATQWVIPDW
jgi:hypothetical protein